MDERSRSRARAAATTAITIALIGGAGLGASAGAATTAQRAGQAQAAQAGTETSPTTTEPVATTPTPSTTAPTVPGGDDRPATAVDIAIAIDTTGSMGPSIEQAKRDAREIVDRTQERLPGARFAVIEFRDSGDTPDYRMAQSMTTSAAAVRTAVASLSADGGGDLPEAYSLLYTRAVDDDTIGYRDEARRILFVLGDAEPHGAANAELPGCEDTSPDPFGLTANGALSGLRRARITLHMILQRSSASTSLRCYRSMAGLSYGRGLATASGAGAGDRDALPLSEIISRAIGSGLPAIAGSGPDTSEEGDSERYGLTVENRLTQPVRLVELSVVAPRGLRYVADSARGITRAAPDRHGARLVWDVGLDLQPLRRRAFAFRLRSRNRSGRIRIPLRATFVMPDGGLYVARTRIPVLVEEGDR